MYVQLVHQLNNDLQFIAHSSATIAQNLMLHVRLYLSAISNLFIVFCQPLNYGRTGLRIVKIITNKSVGCYIMSTIKIDLKNINELQEKILKAEIILSDLKKILTEINNTEIDIILKPS